MRSCPYSLQELLPHGPSIILLDRVIEWTEGYVSCALAVREGLPFFIQGQGVPAHVGLEYMAQCCGAYAGLVGLDAGHAVQLGLLLGTRKFEASRPFFLPGEPLIITAREMMREDPMAVFDCRIATDNNEIATALLNLYRPDDIESILETGGGR